MADWKEKLLNSGLQIENGVDALKRRVVQRLGMDDQIAITVYRGYGNDQIVNLFGRVLEDKGIRRAAVDDSLWDHLLAMYKRIESDEAPGMSVRIESEATPEAVITVSDDEGFLRASLLNRNPSSAGGWLPVTCTLLDAPSGQTQVHFTGQALIPPPTHRFGVISDIDDTIIVSHATAMLQMARLALLNNARQRLPFAGVAELYQALQRGSGGDEKNPIFYVSSSPWNLYDLLEDFMIVHGLPVGPIFLRDYGVDRDVQSTFEHGNHKTTHINALLDFYANTPFILIGDSGQQDPEIYAAIARQHRGRILAIYIRDVSDAGRDTAVRRLIEEMSASGVEMLLIPDSTEAAKHAARRGWIRKS